MYILSTNKVIDNIMYCDRHRKKLELAEALRRAYGRVRNLNPQEREEFRNWSKYILLSICEDKGAVVEEILRWAEDKEEDMAFQYNIIRMFEDEKAEGKAEGKAEDIIDLLEESGTVPETLKNWIYAQKDLTILRQWHKLAARSKSLEEYEAQIGMAAAMLKIE